MKVEIGKKEGGHGKKPPDDIRNSSQRTDCAFISS